MRVDGAGVVAVSIPRSYHFLATGALSAGVQEVSGQYRKQGYRAWKERAKGRITFWGGGVHSQATLPLGSVEDVEREVREVVPVLADGGGYIFCNIHNILAEIAPEKVIAMYRAAE